MTRDKWISIGKGALIAMGGALAGYFADAAAGGQFGAASVIVAAVASVVINALRQLAKPE